MYTSSLSRNHYIRIIQLFVIHPPPPQSNVNFNLKENCYFLRIREGGFHNTPISYSICMLIQSGTRIVCHLNQYLLYSLYLKEKIYMVTTNRNIFVETSW